MVWDRNFFSVLFGFGCSLLTLLINFDDMKHLWSVNDYELTFDCSFFLQSVDLIEMSNYSDGLSLSLS